MLHSGWRLRAGWQKFTELLHCAPSTLRASGTLPTTRTACHTVPAPTRQPESWYADSYRCTWYSNVTSTRKASISLLGTVHKFRHAWHREGRLGLMAGDGEEGGPCKLQMKMELGTGRNSKCAARESGRRKEVILVKKEHYDAWRNLSTVPKGASRKYVTPKCVSGVDGLSGDVGVDEEMSMRGPRGQDARITWNGFGYHLPREGGVRPCAGRGLALA